jgi:hypothetical protein
VAWSRGNHIMELPISFSSRASTLSLSVKAQGKKRKVSPLLVSDSSDSSSSGVEEEDRQPEPVKKRRLTRCTSSREYHGFTYPPWVAGRGTRGRGQGTEVRTLTIPLPTRRVRGF